MWSNPIYLPELGLAFMSGTTRMSSHLILNFFRSNCILEDKKGTDYLLIFTFTQCVVYTDFMVISSW